MPSSIKQDIQRRIDEYLRFTRHARWMVIVIVLISLFVIADQPVIPILTIISGAVCFNLISLAGDKYGWEIFSNRALILLVDTVSAVALVIVTGGQGSLYIPLLLFMVVSSAYWYGAAVAVGIAAIEGVLEALGSELVGGDLMPSWPFIIRVLLFASIGLYLAWLTKSERTGRTQLLSISAETEQERQQLLALINTMSDAVLVADPRGRILLSNSSTASFIDQAKIVSGAYVEGLLKLSDADGKPFRLRLNDVDTTIERRDLKLRITDGSTINAQLTVTPYVVGKKNQGYIFIIRDITREHTIEQERLEFISVAQHELRTPLTVAEGGISMVLTPELQPSNPEALEMLQMSFRSLRQLSRIVSDLTMLSKADSDQIETDMESVDIPGVFAELIEEHKDEAAKKGLELRIVTPKNIQPVITSRYLVYEIMSNFLTNALKFTDHGSIELIAEPRGEDGGVSLSVKDTGRGISTGDQKKLFTNFFQSEDWRTRDHGGTGLGLFISKKLAKRLTAEVSFRSRLGTGSTFTLELPAYSRHAQDQTKVANAETKDFFKYL